VIRVEDLRCPEHGDWPTTSPAMPRATPSCVRPVEALVARADGGVYDAKRAGRNRVTTVPVDRVDTHV
jgi:hypothetical protein